MKRYKPRPRQTRDKEQEAQLRTAGPDIRIAGYMERASTAAYQVVDGHTKNLTIKAMDTLKKRRDLAFSQAAQLLLTERGQSG